MHLPMVAQFGEVFGMAEAPRQHPSAVNDQPYQ